MHLIKNGELHGYLANEIDSKRTLEGTHTEGINMTHIQVMQFQLNKDQIRVSLVFVHLVF